MRKFLVVLVLAGALAGAAAGLGYLPTPFGGSVIADNDGGDLRVPAPPVDSFIADAGGSD